MNKFKLNVFLKLKTKITTLDVQTHYNLQNHPTMEKRAILLVYLLFSFCRTAGVLAKHSKYLFLIVIFVYPPTVACEVITLCFIYLC